VDEFRDNDPGYLDWITRYPDGFVLNVRQKPDYKYVVLHSAKCPTISSRAQVTGAYTSRGYRKYCAEDMGDLVAAAKREGRSDGSFSKQCKTCIGGIDELTRSS
jgi:hypothetical protein